MQELHSFRLESCTRDKRVVGGNVCNVGVALVLKLNGEVSFAVGQDAEI